MSTVKPPSTNLPEFNWRLSTWFPAIEKSKIDQLFHYNSLLNQMNTQNFLVSQRSQAHSDLVHFADSLLACDPVLKKLNTNIDLYDIGSGAGFPGLVLSIVHTQFNFQLVEPEQKKCDFLRLVVNSLGLKNVTILNNHAENLEEDSVDQAIARGYFPLSKSFLELRSIFRKGGQLYLLKSDEWAQEIASVPTQLCSVWSPALFHEYKLPGTQTSLFVVSAKKN